jgi:hypothetical protein
LRFLVEIESALGNSVLLGLSYTSCNDADRGTIEGDEPVSTPTLMYVELLDDNGLVLDFVRLSIAFALRATVTWVGDVCVILDPVGIGLEDVRFFLECSLYGGGFSGMFLNRTFMAQVA